MTDDLKNRVLMLEQSSASGDDVDDMLERLVRVETQFEELDRMILHHVQEEERKILEISKKIDSLHEAIFMARGAGKVLLMIGSGLTIIIGAAWQLFVYVNGVK